MNLKIEQLKYFKKKYRLKIKYIHFITFYKYVDQRKIIK